MIIWGERYTSTSELWRRSHRRRGNDGARQRRWGFAFLFSCVWFLKGGVFSLVVSKLVFVSYLQYRNSISYFTLLRQNCVINLLNVRLSFFAQWNTVFLIFPRACGIGNEHFIVVKDTYALVSCVTILKVMPNRYDIEFYIYFEQNLFSSLGL